MFIDMKPTSILSFRRFSFKNHRVPVFFRLISSIFSLNVQHIKKEIPWKVTNSINKKPLKAGFWPNIPWASKGRLLLVVLFGEVEPCLYFCYFGWIIRIRGQTISRLPRSINDCPTGGMIAYSICCRFWEIPPTKTDSLISQNLKLYLETF